MVDWLKLPDETRRNSLIQVEYKTGIPSKAIEKDWWVTLTLKALFTGKYKNYMVFKGGTSLSKCWKLIERFSEDIDIGLASEAFNVTYEENPTGGFLKRLKRKGYEFINAELKNEIEKRFIELGVPEGLIEIKTELLIEGNSYPDPHTIYVHYQSLFDPNPYLQDVVKIEVSVRTLKEPKATVPVISILTEENPNDAYPEEAFDVIVVEARKTFLEKIFLLHEEFQKPDLSKIKSERMSRHLYDLERIMDKETGVKAIEDIELYNIIIKHRSIYNNLPGIDYTLHATDKISIIPPEEIIEAYKKDYASMQDIMLYGESVSFDILIIRLKELLERLRKREKE